jgi:hypothetical protein
MVSIRRAGFDDRGRVESFYHACDYSGEVTDAAVVFVAEFRGELVGLLRLEPEHGMMVLRGMRVLPLGWLLDSSRAEKFRGDMLETGDRATAKGKQ